MGKLISASYAGLSLARAWLSNVVDARWDNDPFGTKPHGSRSEYLRLFEEARSKDHPEIDELERACGYAIDRSWLEELALRTQIVIKKSELAYTHGRLLYAILRQYIAQNSATDLNIVETGTARGFSALCMAKALADAGVRGRIITVDVLSHVRRQIWNCIDDFDGPKSRAEILEPWSDLTKNIVFLQGDTTLWLPKLGLERIHFAFLDAQHTRRAVLQETSAVASRQRIGDIIVFDDVTPAAFPGVVAAVDEIERDRPYTVERLAVSDQRAYAWATRR